MSSKPLDSSLSWLALNSIPSAVSIPSVNLPTYKPLSTAARNATPVCLRGASHSLSDSLTRRRVASGFRFRPCSWVALLRFSGERASERGSMDATGAVGVGGRDGECHAAQVVGADGEMDAAAIERFAAAAGLQGRGLSYAVVSILGPQGSGTYLLQPRHPPLLLLPPVSPFHSASGTMCCGLRRPRWVSRRRRSERIQSFRHSVMSRMKFSRLCLPSCQLFVGIDR
jgi:hypothetical protein